MTTDPFDLLCERCGVAAEFIEVSGVHRVVSRATRQAILVAMGALEAGEDPAAALARVQRRDCQQTLPPVVVVDEHAQPYRITLSIPEAQAQAPHQWVLSCESGRRFDGVVVPAALEALPAEAGGEGRWRGEFRWESRLPPGYHRFTLQGPAGSASTSLIVTPHSCYAPPSLESGGRVWGPALQLYAIRSERNWGIGDFTDLRNIVELGARAGAGIVGLNPLHELKPARPGDASPYGPSSRLFFNYLYLDVDAVTEAGQCEAARERVQDPEFQSRLRTLRAPELVDYPAVAAAKREILELIYADFRERHLAEPDAHGREFFTYLDEQGDSLRLDSLYCALSEFFEQQDPPLYGWRAWPRDFRRPDSAGVEAFYRERRQRVEFFAWLQWHCERQIAASGRRSMELGLGIGLYEDLAISVDRDGGDAWRWQALLAVEADVGAPPDALNLRGQNWGLPPFLPDRLQAAAYGPYIEMLRRIMRHAGALRIDHVMGLMRLYWVPAGMDATDGGYVHYPFQALLGILALESQRNRCLVVGEDLGTVPVALRDTLARHGVLSTRVMYFEKHADGGFRASAEYPAQAVATITTHDLPTLKGWWAGQDIDTHTALDLYPNDALRTAQIVERAEDRARLLVSLEREQLLPAGANVHPVSAPELTTELMTAVHGFLARSPARVLTVQPEDVFGALEQINVPGTSGQYPNWRRKLPLNLEEWQDDPRFLALTETLRHERGVGAVPPSPVPSPTEDEETATPQAGPPVIPLATYRLQFNRDFTFNAAAAVVPYLAKLGISHCYASPYFKARPGSLHGYDIIDHNAVNPEIGTAEELDGLVAALKTHGMGQIIDVVPNHMGVMGADNGWWLDVLENGQASAYAGYFDIDWAPATTNLKGKLLIPVLGEPYGQALEQGALTLQFDPAHGEFSVHYYEHRFPLDPREYPRLLTWDISRLEARLGDQHDQLLALKSLATALGHLPPRDESDPGLRAERARDQAILKRQLAELCARSADVSHYLAENVAYFNGHPGEPMSFDPLHDLIEAQAYRLACWRVAADEINYRRFFDVDALAALRMENPEVFEATHRLVLALLTQGKIDGLRIDHPDGLFDPLVYLQRLQRRGAGIGAAPKSTYVVVEKILGPDESLPADWPVHGTTGYDFSRLVNGLLIDTSTSARMERIYRSFTHETAAFEDLVYLSKRLIMRSALAGELNVLADALMRIARSDRRTCDFTLNSLRDALREVVACFPVYRTYVSERGLSLEDENSIRLALKRAARRSRSSDPSVLEFLGEVLLTGIAEGRSPAFRQTVLQFVMKFQQYTAPVTAKGTEDTAFYIYNRLLSLNEVGDDPSVFGVSVLAFHRANRERQRLWPHAMINTSTHDGKRSEDVRARLDVLSELPDQWRAQVRHWERLNRHQRRQRQDQRTPSRGDEYRLYQTLLGIWPLLRPDEAALSDLRARVVAYMVKAIREAKVHSAWINPNEDYEAGVLAFVEEVLAGGSDTPFLAAFIPFAEKIARLGIYNSLTQLLLKLSCPGVPDFYQGSEIWNFSLVDPDNRRPVDYGIRHEMLDVMQDAFDQASNAGAYAASLLETMNDGRLKLFLTWRMLALRRQMPAVFLHGDYQPLRVTGSRAEHLIALSRTHADEAVLVAAPRLPARLGVEDHRGLGEAAWGDTTLVLPSAGAWENFLTGERLQVSQPSAAAPAIAASKLFAGFPWVVLKRLDN